MAPCAHETTNVAGADQQKAESKRTRWQEVRYPSGPRGWTGHGGCVARRAWVASNVKRDAKLSTRRDFEGLYEELISGTSA